MRISAQIGIVIAVIFALICFSVAFNGFSSLGELTDPAQKSDALGFAWFWTFLGSIAIVFGGFGAWIVKTGKEI